MNIATTNLYFSTYTNLNWIKVLEKEEYKNIVMNSLIFLANDKRIELYAFVIMPNHIHIVWRILGEHILPNVQRDFLKFTAQKIKFRMIETNDPLLDELVVYSKDRNVQIWERNGLSFILNNRETILQKINYIHNNPVQAKWQLTDESNNYKYSSAAFYENNKDDFGCLTNIINIL